MNGEIYMAVVLCLFGNAYKQNYSIENYLRKSNAFPYCGHVRFISREQEPEGSHEGVILENVLDWYRNTIFPNLGLRLFIPSGRKDFSTVGFVGGGNSVMIELVGETSSSLWQSAWNYVPERKKWFRTTKAHWNVDYHRMGDTVTDAVPNNIDIPQATDLIRSALHNILDFTRANNCGFEDSFQNALEECDRPNPAVDHNLTPPDFLDKAAQRLLNSASKAWVFGGMGSWNDQYITEEHGEIQKQYDQVSRDLYSAILTALQAVVASTFPSTHAAGIKDVAL